MVNDADGSVPGEQLDLLLADDYFFAAHDDVNGRVRLNDRAVGMGLASALLGELILFRRITFQQGMAVVVDGGRVPDALVNRVLAQMEREPEPRPIRDWLRYLGRDAYELVAQRMVREGLVRVTQARRFRRSTSYQPVDLNAAAWPLLRVARKLARREPVVLPDIVLAGLIHVTGLERYLRIEAVTDIGEYRDHLIAGLPRPLRVLVAETEAAIGDAVMHHRM